MRILMVDVNYGHSSTGNIVDGLKAEMEAEGHQVLACFGRGPKVPDEQVLNISSKLEVLKHVALTRITGRTGGYSGRATHRLRDAIKRFAPDVVHLHELHGYYV